MSDIKLTESQQIFVNTYNKNTLVSASAGSGKTSTMIAKLTKMIVEEHIPIKKLLVVTYTNSAGSEMKQKLFNSLVKKMQELTDEESISFISEQLDDMVNCDIGTLHSVCKKIIKTYFYVVEQDPTFSLLNEQQSDYIYDNAMNKVFGTLIEQDNEDFYYVYSLYNKKRNLNNLKYVIKTLHNYMLSKVDAGEWKQYVIDNCCSNEVPEKYLFEYYKDNFNQYIQQFEQHKKDCEKYFETYVNYVGDRLNFVLEIQDLTSYEQMFNFVSNYEFYKKPRITSSKLSPEDLDMVESVDLTKKDFSDLIKNFKANFISMSEVEISEYTRLIRLLFDLVEQIKNEYDKEKKRLNVLDFSDLEHITLQILDNEGIRNTLKEKYEYIFVDEYQDINQVQETIISKLTRTDNLYMIGDVKQSIYAFRLSSPEIFINKYNRFLIEDDINKVVNLNENFRSQENILEFSNLIFNKLITKNTIGIDYESSSQLVAGLKCDFKKCVSIDIIDEENEISEAQVITNKVGELIKEGYIFRDIAILLRSKGELVNEISDYFKKYNIPCEATYKTDLFKNNEVLVIYYLLKCCNNCYDDLGVSTVLKSKFIGLNEDELAEIRLINSELTFSECVFEYVNSGTNEHIKQKINNFYNLIKNIRWRLDNMSISEMLDWLVVEFDVFNYYLSFVDGLEKVNNIKEFIKLVSNEEYRYDLQKCIDYLENIKKNGEVTLTLTNVSNSVKIMTIHSSKGLEYPAVILGGVGKKFVLNKQTEDIIINDKLGVGVKQFNIKNHTQKDSVVKNACKISNKKGEIDEEIRLLYVALTRAKQRLCIVGQCDTKDIRRNVVKNIYNSRCYFDLIFKALPNNVLHYFENKIDNFVVCDNTSAVFDVNFIKDMKVDVDNGNRSIIFSKDYDNVLSKLNKYFDYHYKFENSKNIAVKNSVSQVLKEEVDYENHIDSVVSNEMLDDHSLKLGTAYHTIMQNINYCENIAEISELINRVKTLELPYDEINPERILNAINNVKKFIQTDSKLIKEAQFVMKTNYGKLTNSEDDVDVLIQGVIDLVILNKNNAIIIDFKTNKTHNKKYLIDHYGLQLKMYAEAFEKAYKIKVDKKLLYSFEMNDFIEV